MIRLGGPPVDNVAIDEEGQATLVRLAGISALLGHRRFMVQLPQSADRDHVVIRRLYFRRRQSCRLCGGAEVSSTPY